MAVPYESRAHAVADAAVAVVENLHRVALASPHACTMCGRSAGSLSNWQNAFKTEHGVTPCGRVFWLRLTHCRGRLVRAVTS